jgi:hypothetical protein
MKPTYRFANADEYPKISAFLDAYWAKDHIYCRDKPLFDWTFSKRAHWQQDGYSFALAEEGDTLIGILGGIPFYFNVFGKTMNGVWIANYVISPEHRRGTLALQLLSQFRSEAFPAVIASGINPATSTIYKVLRGQVLAEIPRHFLVLPGQSHRLEKLLEIARPEWDADKSRFLANSFEMSQLPAGGAASGKCIPASWDEVDWPEIAARTVGAARTRDYLLWRYQRHPDFEYRIITVADGARTGLAVWRLETIRKATDAGRVDVEKIGRLVEFLPASPENAEALFAEFVNQLKASDAMGADYYGYHGPTRETLRQLGFRPTDEVAGADLPSRFQPLDGKGGGILSAMFVPADTPACTTAADCPWYWTKSDSDQDRPN